MCIYEFAVITKLANISYVHIQRIFF